MKKLLLAATLVVVASSAQAYTHTSRFTWNGVTTVCTYTSPYGTNCYTTGVGTGNSAKVISVPETNPAPQEHEMSEAERAAARRATCASRSVVCLPEPSW